MSLPFALLDSEIKELIPQIGPSHKYVTACQALVWRHHVYFVPIYLYNVHCTHLRFDQMINKVLIDWLINSDVIDKQSVLTLDFIEEDMRMMIDSYFLYEREYLRPEIGAMMRILMTDSKIRRCHVLG